MLSRAEVIEPAQMTGTRVKFGAYVSLEDVDSGEEKTLPHRRRRKRPTSRKGTISVTSPMARACINHEVGDEVRVNAPGGTRKYQITDHQVEVAHATGIRQRSCDATTSSELRLAVTTGSSCSSIAGCRRRAPKAVVQIAHGMAEHAGRYARLAAALIAAGYAVYAHDQRGHGKTARSARATSASSRSTTAGSAWSTTCTRYAGASAQRASRRAACSVRPQHGLAAWCSTYLFEPRRQHRGGRALAAPAAAHRRCSHMRHGRSRKLERLRLGRARPEQAAAAS